MPTKKPTEAKPQVNLKIKTFTFNGIAIRVKIDYDKGLASLVDDQNYNKQWCFASRGLEYMNGWLNIIGAMKLAVEEAKKLLEADLAEKSSFDYKMIEKLENNK
jgi:hypothetical protein